MSDKQPDKNEIQDVQALFSVQGVAAGNRSGLSQATTDILIQNLSPMIYVGTQGLDPYDLGADRAFLFVPVLDMTASMGSYRNDVIGAYNEMLAALGESKQAEDILMSSWTFNQQSYPLHKYVPLEYVPKLNAQTYRPTNGTALYDAIPDALTGVVAYGEKLRQSGARTKIVLVVFTDGEDNMSRHTAQEVKTVVSDLLEQEIYTFALVAFGGGYAKKVAAAMGFPSDNVLEVKDVTPSAIRHAVNTVSKSVIRQSQTIVTNNTNGFFTL